MRSSPTTRKAARPAIRWQSGCSGCLRSAAWWSATHRSRRAAAAAATAAAAAAAGDAKGAAAAAASAAAAAAAGGAVGGGGGGHGGVSVAGAMMSPLARLLARGLPVRGDIVAIDTEFVSVELAGGAVRADGTREMTSLGRQALARVSCVDGRDGRVIIDDYVTQPEVVVDHATRFSGLTAADLDPATSAHHLVPLRVAYVGLCCFNPPMWRPALTVSGQRAK